MPLKRAWDMAPHHTKGQTVTATIRIHGLQYDAMTIDEIEYTDQPDPKMTGSYQASGSFKFETPAQIVHAFPCQFRDRFTGAKCGLPAESHAQLRHCYVAPRKAG